MTKPKHEVLAALRDLKARHERTWLEIAGVVGVGLGARADSSPCIVISIDRDTPELRREVAERVPKVDVEIRVVGQPRAL